MTTTLITTAGQQAIAAAVANNEQINITKIAVGDGASASYIPAPSQTALKNEKWIGPLNSVALNSENLNQVIFEGLIASGVGGFYIREVGLYDENDTLIAVSDFPESYKASADQYDLYVRMVLEMSSTDANVIVNKDMVYATKQFVRDSFVDATTEQKGVVKLSSILSEDDSTAMTPKGVKDAIEEEASGKFIPVFEKEIANGIATLDESGKLKEEQKPVYKIDEIEYQPGEGTLIANTGAGTLNGSQMWVKSKTITLRVGGTLRITYSYQTTYTESRYFAEGRLLKNGEVIHAGNRIYSTGGSNTGFSITMDIPCEKGDVIYSEIYSNGGQLGAISIRANNVLADVTS